MSFVREEIKKSSFIQILFQGGIQNPVVDAWFGCKFFL